MNDHIKIETDANGVAHVRLNRPDKKNALSLEMLDVLVQAGETLKADRDLRAVILSGEGGVFSAGIDLSLMQSFATRLDEVRQDILTAGPGGANRFQRPCTIWRELDVPVIAAMEGVAFGAGLQLALGADFRFGAPSLRLSVMEMKWGLIPDMGITQSLPRLMRADLATELMMNARVLEAPQAQALGLLTRIEEAPLTAAKDFAAALCLRSPDALAGVKRLVDQGWGGGPSALKCEATLQAAIIGAPNQISAVMAGMTGGAAKFGPRRD